MRSLSMRIANPHLLSKKPNRFMSYNPTKKSKAKKNIDTFMQINSSSTAVEPTPQTPMLLSDEAKATGKSEATPLDKINVAQSVKSKK